MFHHQTRGEEEDEDQHFQEHSAEHHPAIPALSAPAVEFDEATQLSELLHTFSTSPPAPPSSLHKLRSLSTRLFRLLDPSYDCSSHIPSPHIHSALLYRDRHRGGSDESSVVELLPLLLHRIQHASLTAAQSPSTTSDSPPAPGAEPPPLPSPSSTVLDSSTPPPLSESGCLSAFLSLRWPLCCLPSLCRLCTSLSLSASQVRQVQANIQQSIVRARCQPTELLSLFTLSPAHCSSADDDSIPILQAILLLIRRYQLADSPLAATTASLPAARDDVDSSSPLSNPPAPSWLSLLHSVLSQRSSSVTTATSLYLLDNSMQHSPVLCTYILEQMARFVDEPHLPSLDHMHVVLLLLMARDEDYRARCIELLTQLTQAHLAFSLHVDSADDAITTPVPQYTAQAPLVSFIAALDPNISTIELWSAAIRVAGVERVPVTTQFAVHLLKKHSSSPSLLSTAFHIFHLLFLSFEPARAGVFDVVLSNICRSSLALPQRHLFASLLSHLVVQSQVSQLSKLHGTVDAFLHNLILLPLPLALHTLWVLLPVFIPSVAQWSSAPLDSLHTYLRKWLLHPSREYDVLALSGCLWLLGRWGGWEAEEKGLCKLLEEGLARQTEEGRGWLACQLHQLIVSHASAPERAALLSLSAHPPLSDTSLSSLLLHSSTRLSSSALSYLRSYLLGRLSVYISQPSSKADAKTSKWNVVVEHSLLSVAACFRAEWASVTTDAGDEAADNELVRRRRAMKLKSRKAGKSDVRTGLVSADSSNQRESQRCAVLRDPIPLYLLCAWDSLQAEAASLSASASSSSSSSSSSPASTHSSAALVSMLYSLLDQFLDSALFLPLVCSDPPAKSDTASPSVATASSLAIGDRQRWSLLQALCLVLCRIAFEDTSRWRRETRAAVEAAIKADAARKPVPLSTWTFTSKLPEPVTAAAEEVADKLSGAEKDDAVKPSLYALLAPLSSSSAIPLPLTCDAGSCFYFLEQAAFLQLLTDCSPNNASPLPAAISVTLTSSLLLPPSLLVDILSEYSRSLSIFPAASLLIQDKKREPALSSVAVAHTLKLLTAHLPSLLGKAPPPSSSAFDSLPSTQWMPSLTPSSSFPSTAAVLSSVFDVFCATLGLNVRRLDYSSLVSPSPLPCSPPSVIGTAVFSSAKQLASLFKLASLSSSATLSSPAWLRATAVYEQPAQYKDEVWAVRLHALLAIKLVVTEQPEQASTLCDALFDIRLRSADRVDGVTLLALLLVRCFHVELEQRMTVTLAHAYIELVQTLHSLSAATSEQSAPAPSPATRLTETLLHSINEDPELLTADYRLTRKVYAHILSSMQGDSGRQCAMTLAQQLISRLLSDEAQADSERKEREKRTGSLPHTRNGLTKRTKRRRRNVDGEHEQDADGSDDSEFDDDGERRRERFLSRFTRSAVMEAEETREEERRDRLEMKVKRSRKAVLTAIVRYVSRELSDVRQQWKQSKQARKRCEQKQTVGEQWSTAQSACVFLSHSLSVLSFLASPALSSLLDYSFTSPATQLSSERPSMALYLPSIAALLEWSRCTLELLHSINSLLSAHTAEVAPMLLGGQLMSEPVLPHSTEDRSTPSFGYVEQLSSSSSSSGDALLLLVQHMLQALYSTAAQSNAASFLSAATTESMKAIDAKLAIERCREAALTTTSLIARLIQQQAEGDQASEDGQEEKQEEGARESGEQDGCCSSSLSPATIPSSAATAQFSALLAFLHTQLRAGGRHVRMRDAVRDKAEAVSRKRPRGKAVLRSRNRVVDGMLREERERGDSYMDLDDFLVGDDEEVD